MAEENKAHDDVRAALGYKNLNRFWAKVEILFGLFSAGVGMLVGMWAVSRTKVELNWAGAALLLFMLGWYLALAGTRSHLYRSMHDLTALTIDEMRKMDASRRVRTSSEEVSRCTVFSA